MAMSDVGAVEVITAVAVFEDEEDANEATQRLTEAGVPQSHINRISGHAGDGSQSQPQASSGQSAGGQSTGGQTTGDMAASGSDTSDDTGPDAAIAIIELGIPDDEIDLYADSLDEGGILLAVTDVAPDSVAIIIDILDDEDTIDLDAREQSRGAEAGSQGSSATRDMPAGGRQGDMPQLTRQQSDRAHVRTYAGPQRQRMPVGGDSTGAESRPH
jgi:hypothetical protein